jgi:hypothetical protein
METITLQTPEGEDVVFQFGVHFGQVVMTHPVDGGLFRHRFSVDEARVVVGMLQHQVDLLDDRA